MQNEIIAASYPGEGNEVHGKTNSRTSLKFLNYLQYIGANKSLCPR